jgi:hypothetical protein
MQMETLWDDTTLIARLRFRLCLSHTKANILTSTVGTEECQMKRKNKQMGEKQKCTNYETLLATKNNDA